MLPSQLLSISARFRLLPSVSNLLAATCLALLLTACGGVSEPVQTGDMSIRLSGSASAISNGQVVAKATSDNLLDLNRSWSTWSGDASGVTYNADSGTLSIPASSDSVAMVTAVERYELSLVAGTEYTLAVESSHPEMAAILFLFDTKGAIVPVPGVSTSLASVRSSAPLTFAAPENIAGLYLQVQNRWQAAGDGVLSAQLTFQEDDELEPGTGDSTELLNPVGIWTAWDGTDNGVTYDNAAQAVVIDTPDADAGNRYGIMRFNTSLTAGATYTLRTLVSSAPDAGTLLFLFDGSGTLVPYTNPETDAVQSWIAAPAGQPVSFVAPAGITSVVVQVQSGWMALSPTAVRPSLTTRVDTGSCIPELLSLSEPMALPNAPGPLRSHSSSTSANGRYTVFTSERIYPSVQDPTASRPEQLHLYDNETGDLERILPTNNSTDGSYYIQVISADGSTIYFTSTDGANIDGQDDGVGVHSVFRFDRLQGLVTRVMTGTSGHVVETIGVSPDGKRALIRGPANLLLDETQLDPSLASSQLIEYNATTGTAVARAFPSELQGYDLVVSDDLIHVVYQTYSHPIFVNGTRVGYTEATYSHRNLDTGISRVIASGNTDLTAERWTHDISPDGKYVVFKGSRTPFTTSDGRQFDGKALYRWESGTDRIEEVARHDQPEGELQSPSISGDGNLIAYQHDFIAPGVSAVREVRVTSFMTSRTIAIGNAGFDAVPKLSADGSAILFLGAFDNIVRPARSTVEYRCES